jgi:hypothetical protein
MTLDGEPLGMRSNWLSCTMALAETTVVETVSGGWPQVLSGLEVLLEANQLAARTKAGRPRRREVRDGGEEIAALVMI